MRNGLLTVVSDVCECVREALDESAIRNGMSRATTSGVRCDRREKRSYKVSPSISSLPSPCSSPARLSLPTRPHHRISTMPVTAPSPPILYSFASPTELCDAVADFILKAQKEAIDKKGRFSVALSGGSLPQQLNALINKPGVRWDKWCVAFSSFQPAI